MRSTTAAAHRDTCGYLRAIAVHFEGVDAGLVPALSLQEGAIFRQLQAGTAKMAPLKYFDPVMLAVLGTKGFESTSPKNAGNFFPIFYKMKRKMEGCFAAECEKQSDTTNASAHRACRLVPPPSMPLQPEKQPETPRFSQKPPGCAFPCQHVAGGTRCAVLC